MVVPGKSFTRRKYSPRFLITISSLPMTSSTTRPTWAVVRVGNHHAKITVDRFKRRKTEIRIQSDDFRHHIANFGEQLAADVFDFIGAQAANFPPRLLEAKRSSHRRNAQTAPAK